MESFLLKIYHKNQGNTSKMRALQGIPGSKFEKCFHYMGLLHLFKQVYVTRMTSKLCIFSIVGYPSELVGFVLMGISDLILAHFELKHL